jgi:hypothetical protein
LVRYLGSYTLGEHSRYIEKVIKPTKGALPFALVMIGEKTWFKNIRMPPHITENDPFVHDLAIRAGRKTGEGKEGQ